MSKPSTVDVLICGAGAAGLMLALELARRAISFRLIDKLDAPFEGSRGKGIQPRTQEVFEDIGILDRLTASGGPYPPHREYRADGSGVDTERMGQNPPTPAEPYRSSLMAPQWMTEAALRERLLELGHRPAYSTALTGLQKDPQKDAQQDTQGVTAQLAGPGGEEVVRARYLVGADGGRSFVRQALGIGFPGKTLQVRALVADVTLTGLSREHWHQFNRGTVEQGIALCPLAGTQLFQLQAAVPLEGEVDLSVQGLSAMVTERSGRDDIRIESVSWASVYSMNARLADRFRCDDPGRVLLIGDAAHVHPPTGGQGLNTSVQDAYNLGWKLAAVVAGAPEALLDSYEEERRPIAREVLGLSTRLLDAARQADMRRGREVQQLDLGYRGSSLALQAPQRTERADLLQAGDRAPDAPIQGAAGQPARLFGLLRGTHWTLVGYEADRTVVKARRGLHIHVIGKHGELIDAGGHFRQAYGLTPAQWVLVRPDGYVGAILGSHDLEALEGYFQRCGL